jgi:hypothetical protein
MLPNGFHHQFDGVIVLYVPWPREGKRRIGAGVAVWTREK